MTTKDLHHASMRAGEREREEQNMTDLTAALQAFEVDTGKLLWSYEFPPYGRVAAAGDEEGVLIRNALGNRNKCKPSQFSSPTLSNEGTVYVGRADGKVWAVGDQNGDGIISPQEVDTFDTGAGFPHPGASFAPGMMA